MNLQLAILTYSDVVLGLSVDNLFSNMETFYYVASIMRESLQTISDFFGETGDNGNSTYNDTSLELANHISSVQSQNARKSNSYFHLVHCPDNNKVFRPLQYQQNKRLGLVRSEKQEHIVLSDGVHYVRILLNYVHGRRAPSSTLERDSLEISIHGNDEENALQGCHWSLLLPGKGDSEIMVYASTFLGVLKNAAQGRTVVGMQALLDSISLSLPHTLQPYTQSKPSINWKEACDRMSE